jgi:DNA polymerase I-like protein with 3'-5' exonuclease and polymerase domains
VRPVILDIETSARHPWNGKLLVTGIGTQAYEGGLAQARMLLARPNLIVCQTNFDLSFLGRAGVKMHPGVEYHDVKVMSWLVDPLQSLALDDLTERWVGYRPPKYIKKRGGVIMWDHPAQPILPIEDAPIEQVIEYNKSDLSSTADLYERMKTELMARDMWEHFLEYAVPFSKLLVEMEVAGVPLDRARTEALLAEKVADMDRLEQELKKSVGLDAFKPSSPAHVSDYLFTPKLTINTRWNVKEDAPVGAKEIKRGRVWVFGTASVPGLKLKPPPSIKNKDGSVPKRPSVRAPTLRAFFPDHEWIGEYLKYKRLQKLTSSFLEPLLDGEHNGRIYGGFDQSGTDTGRIAAKEPNLMAMDKSDDIRSLFAGALVVGDYAGLEVRLSAHFSQDPRMLDIFLNGKDLYGTFAADAWGGPETKANPRRALMKTLVLGTQYGAQAKKLAQVLNEDGFRHSVKEAGELLKTLESVMPRMFEWREEVIAQARYDKYVETIAGVKRPLPNIDSKDWKEAADSERQAVSTKVQGSASEIVRGAMLAARSAVDPSEARMILQVHDEILWERGEQWSTDAFDRLRLACETGYGYNLSVPLIFEAKEAQSWAEK